MPASSQQSVGYDFFIIINHEANKKNIEFEIATKVDNFDFSADYTMSEKTLKQHAMSANLGELIPDFNYQKQNWKKNKSETHLFAITKIDEVHNFIPFAHSSENVHLPDYMKFTY